MNEQEVIEILRDTLFAAWNTGYGKNTLKIKQEAEDLYARIFEEKIMDDTLQTIACQLCGDDIIVKGENRVCLKCRSLHHIAREFPEAAVSSLVTVIRSRGQDKTYSRAECVSWFRRIWEGMEEPECPYCHQKIDKKVWDGCECWCHDGIGGCECGYKGDDVKKHREQHFQKESKGGCPTCGGSGELPPPHPGWKIECPNCNSTGERRKGEQRALDRGGHKCGRRKLDWKFYNAAGFHDPRSRRSGKERREGK